MLESGDCALRARVAGGYAPCAALYTGGCGGLCLLEVLAVLELPEVMRCVLL